MKNFRKNALLVSITMSVLSCSSNEMKMESMAEVDTKNKTLEELKLKKKAQGEPSNISSIASYYTPDTSLRFVRKARLKYKTDNVQKSTYVIENEVVAHRGIVTLTNLESNILSIRESEISNDSILRITEFVVKNTIQIRIPNTQLHSFLKQITNTVAFLDKRKITAEEVSLQQLKKQLEQLRLQEFNASANQLVRAKNNKLTKTVAVYENILNKKEQQDIAMLHNKELAYDIAYSNVVLEIYQEPTIKKEVIANVDKDYEVPFVTQLKTSIIKGWKNFLWMLVAFLNIWVFLLILSIVWYFVIKKKK